MTTSTPRQINEIFYQGEDERIAYFLTTTPWGSSPTNVSVACYDITNGGRVDASSKLNGAASVSGDIITCPILENLIPNKKYRLEIKFICGGNTFEVFAIINSEF